LEDQNNFIATNRMSFLPTYPSLIKLKEIRRFEISLPQYPE